MFKKFLSIYKAPTIQQTPIAIRKTISHISEIPLTFNVCTLFGFTGLISGLSVILIPTHYIETQICLPFPNKTNLYKNNSDSDTNNSKLIALFLTCSMCYGYVAGKVYQYKMFKLGDYKRFYRILGYLVNKTPLTLIHCSGFTLIVFYGMFGVFTLFETLLYGKPYGLDDQHDKYLNLEYGNKQLLAYDKKIFECNSKQMVYRCKLALEITAHWTQSTFFLLFPIFFGSSSILFVTHRRYWLALLSRLKKP